MAIQDPKLCVVGKVITDRTLGNDGFVSIAKGTWRIKDLFTLSLIDYTVSTPPDISQESSLRWIPSTNSYVKLNCDTSFTSSRAVWDVIARNFDVFTAIIADIIVWMSQFVLCISWISLNFNFAGHHVAKLVFNSHDTFIWDVTFLAKITSIARSDII